MKTIAELGDELCEYCPLTMEGPVNTGSWNLCEGRACKEAYENYLDKYEEDTKNE